MEDSSRPCTRIGIISDTHGLFRAEISGLFDGVSRIIHAGDIGRPAILRELEKIAPTVAVLGNTDIASWYPGVAKTAFLEINNRNFYVVHDVAELDLDPVAAGVDAVLYGHSHTPAAEKRGGVWFVNPGSAGPPRSRQLVSVAIIEIGENITVRHHTLR